MKRFPDSARVSKFIHLVRHPGDFVRSAIRKGWHKNDSIWESGRIKLSDTERWSRFSHIEKLSWLWVTTNQYIREFQNSVSADRFMVIRIEDISDSLKQMEVLFDFVGSKSIPKEILGRFLNHKINELGFHPNEPPNMKKVIDFPEYNSWSSSMKEEVWSLVLELALKHEYNKTVDVKP